MRQILVHRGLRLVFFANMISMFGSGLNSAAVVWRILEVTHSETYLALLVVLQTIPAMLLLPFSGVVIDREDRRRLLMLLDLCRGVVILVVALLALEHRDQLWQLYCMAILVALGFWMFWPTVTALIQELTPGGEFVEANTLLMAGVQGGWLIAGAIVGFLYNKLGLGGILLIDVSTYAISFMMYLQVRKGRVVVERPDAPIAPEHELKGSVALFLHEMKEGLHYLRSRRDVILLGSAWSLFLGGMMTSGVVTAPLSERILHAGAVGYGWLNGGWGIGAFISTFYTAWMMKRAGSRGTVRLTMATLAIFMAAVPYFHFLWPAVITYFIMGSCRGTAGVGITASMMEMVPKHLIGRIQNTFYFAGLLLQLTLGALAGVVAHRVGLAQAYLIIACTFAAGALVTVVPVHRTPQLEPAGA